LDKPDFVHLTQAGVSLLIDLSQDTAEIVHWGNALGEIKDIASYSKAAMEPVAHAELDEPMHQSIWRENSRGNTGHPALLGHAAGKGFSQKFEIVSVEQTATEATITGRDDHAGLEITNRYRFLGSGVIGVTQSILNLGTAPFTLNELNVFMPLPDHVAESMDFTGRWVNERQLQRREIQPGLFVREEREGRSSHDYTIMQYAMTLGAGYQTGEVWGLGIMFSGNSKHIIERQQSGRTFIAAGELLLPGEVILQPREEFESPEVAAVYSAAGIDGTTNRIYSWLRARPNHPTNIRPRPLTLNVWEAVYFDHNLEKLSQLAEVAQRIGVERFVLDDGWFGSRRDDHKGLGDWVVSPDVWPNGLGPLIEKVHACGMEFGLWFEGEMLNADSDVYRAHPDWILKVGDRVPPEGRHQHVLDITNQSAYQHLMAQVDKVLSENEIAYIKWDHNKFLLDPASGDVPAVHKQAEAIYRFFDELKRRHPGLEIESCASGGGRIDLGMALHADRFWTSDCNDAADRQRIQRYTQFAIPPELLGSHIGPTKSHTTLRVHELSFRAVTALFGHAGLEWDITQCSEDELAHLKNWATYYKQNRDLLHSGNMVRVDRVDDTSFVHGVVSQDQRKAIFAYATLGTQGGSRPAGIRFAGLNEHSQYRVRAVFPAGEPKYLQRANVQWLDGVELSGSALMHMGLRAPILFPDNAFLIEIEAI
jgi:alpha-galactosidase